MAKSGIKTNIYKIREKDLHFQKKKEPLKGDRPTCDHCKWIGHTKAKF